LDFSITVQEGVAIRVLVLSGTKCPSKVALLYTAVDLKQDRVQSLSVGNRRLNKRNIEDEKIKVVRPGAMKSRCQGREDSVVGVLIAVWERSTKAQV
jgi:hypothetical protein